MTTKSYFSIHNFREELKVDLRGQESKDSPFKLNSKEEYQRKPSSGIKNWKFLNKQPSENKLSLMCSGYNIVKNI